MGTIRFEVRKDKPDACGLLPVRLIYQVEGQREYYSTKKKILPLNWDTSGQKAVFMAESAAKSQNPKIDVSLLLKKKDVENFNYDLQHLSKRVEKIEKRFEAMDKSYSSAMVVAELKSEDKPKTKKEQPSNLVFQFIEKYIEDHKAIREPGSLSVYKALGKHLAAYQERTAKTIAFDKIDYNTFMSFQNFLITHRGLNNTTVAKQLGTLKTFLGYARKEGVVVSDSYKDFKVKKQPLEVITLTHEEFERLFSLDLSKKQRLSKVRDVFCFACATGLRYSDLYQLKREHIKDDVIKLTIKKTKEILSIPLNPYSTAILAKYQKEDKPIPVISNQRMNDYIKELCKLANINEPVEIVRFRGAKRESEIFPKHELIGVHTARKTFATLSLEKGMNAEEVMSITGHKDYKSFKRYVNITEQRKKEAMRQTWGKEKVQSPK